MSMLRSVLRLAAAAALPLVGGCFTLLPYGTDGATEVAMVRFVSNFDGSTHVNAVDLSQCPQQAGRRHVASMTALVFGGGEVSSLRMIGTSPNKEELIRERKVVAGKPLLLHLRGVRPATLGTVGWQCGFALSFEPKPGQQYEVRFRADVRSCIGGVSRLGTDQTTGAVTRTPEANARLLPARDPDDLCRI